MSCPSIPELDLDQWSEILLGKLDGKRYPLSGTLEVTNRCNLRCVHCYINQPPGSRVEISHELDTDALISIIDRIVDAGCLFLLITGGEPLLRSDFPQIYMHAKRRGLMITLFTNATLITQEIADLLAAFPPRMVDISIYGASRETYESVTSIKGSFDRFMRGIHLLRERNIPISIKTIVLTVNKHELSRMKFFAEELGLKFRYDGLVWPRRDGGESPLKYRISADDLLALDLESSERVHEWKKLGDEFRGILGRKDYVFTCGAGIRSFHINSRGEMSICTMVSQPVYDLKEMRFEEAWEKIGELRKWKRKMNTECETCSVNGYCLQCPGWSLASHGDFETPDEFVCELGKKRALHIEKLLL